jgi:nitrogen regulatory protein PII-like uncharacterized protein
MLSKAGFFIYDYHQTSAEYVLNNRSLWGDPYNCFQVIQDDERQGWVSGSLLAHRLALWWSR